ncbi:hypothetical protein C8F04DRAFT_57743 [Mycena alexandri]|uniref:Uncharacterized protein n=1 Tax=Mycena alexandri TaxID=1745969 RepID=A0AAD6TCQ4_9AGAR|nr:hypothetical protein C8F04DRAFT_57743 [Mycena alexandri]
MSATDTVVQQNAAYHAELLAGIASFDYVPSALTEQEALIASLEETAKQNAARIRALEQKTQKERKEHEDLRDSTARRFAAKLTGRKDKFEAKASKEEREYVEALEKEVQEKRQQANLETMISEAKAVRNDLLSKVQIYNVTKGDLEALYSRIFDGPTQAYPEDDHLEYQLQQAQGRYNEIQGYLNRASQSTAMLQSADSALRSCNRELQQALNYSEWDMWGGGTFTDMMERNALSSAEGLAMQAATYVQQAMIADQQVQPIGQISIAHGSIMSDVIFDNVFTDMAFHKKIKASALNLEAVQLNLTRQLDLARSRAGAIGADLNAAADALARAREALHAFRRHVFENLSGNAPAYDAPPYDTPTVQITMPITPEPESTFTPPPHGPPGGFAPLSPPQHAPEGAYAPPPGPPPQGSPSPGGSRTSSPSPPSAPMSAPRVAGLSAPRVVGLPSSPKPMASLRSYAPPLGPPPGGSRAASPSHWGSRNPYAAALATSNGGSSMGHSKS